MNYFWIHVMLILTQCRNKYRRRKQWYGYLDRIWVYRRKFKAYILSNFRGYNYRKFCNCLVWFTSTSQTSNGDVAGVDDKLPGVLDKSWEELGVIINGTLDNISSGEILK
jgi:hypothetical protein